MTSVSKQCKLATLPISVISFYVSNKTALFRLLMSSVNDQSSLCTIGSLEYLLEVEAIAERPVASGCKNAVEMIQF